MRQPAPVYLQRKTVLKVPSHPMIPTLLRALAPDYARIRMSYRLFGIGSSF